MYRYIFLLTLLIVLINQSLQADNYYKITGVVRDKENNEPIDLATVSIIGTDIGVYTESDGSYMLCDIQEGNYQLLINSFGYTPDTLSIHLHSDIVVNTSLSRSAISLDEVVVNGAANWSPKVIRNLDISQPVNNFSKIISEVPGVAVMDIGSSVSKPVIRGLGFNRVALINKGIVQQNQQWGADHGIEVNPFDMESIKIYKGASSLMFGSDAMAGAIEVVPDQFTNRSDKTSLQGEALLWGATNNDMLGGAMKLDWGNSKYFARGIFSYQDYADYRVPASEFDYMSYVFPIYNNRLKNTAGKESNISLTGGYMFDHVKTIFNVSNNYQKNGFFSGAHGLPDIANMQPDGSYRNIGFPYNTANHLAITNSTEWQTDQFRLQVNLGYQNNHRQELSAFHTHYDLPEIPDDPNLELDFRLQTYSANVRLLFDEHKAWQKTIGVSAEYQKNRIGGYNFFLPKFDQKTVGVFFTNTYIISAPLKATGGIRFDYGKMDISGFYDPNLVNHLQNQGYSPADVDENAWRANDVNRNFENFSAALGINYVFTSNRNISLYSNVGKSFRFPTAVELASNGVHHGAFRHEIGNPNLNPEQGYSFDFGFVYDSFNNIRIELSPFVNYFSNFIYLEPTLQWSILPEAGQTYNYNQAKVIMGGGEYQIKWYITQELSLSSMGEYVINQNLDNDYPLPFTPPFSMQNEVNYTKKNNKSSISKYFFAASHQYFANQNRIARGEETTPRTNLFNLSAGFDYKINNRCTIQFSIQARNIFNTAYYNHLSFYRKLNIPEPGRNIQAFIRIPFGS